MTQEESTTVGKGESITNDNPSADMNSTNAEDDGWVDILGSGGIMKKILTTGDGEKTRPLRGDRVTLNISGQLESNGRKVDCHEGLVVTVGDCDLCHGVDLVLALMELNEESLIKVDQKFAYGARGREPDVPSNATITYTVKVLKVDEPLDSSKMQLTEILNVAEQKRSRGNIMYTREDYHDAIHIYNKAIELLDDSGRTHDSESTEKIQECIDCRIKCYNNLAAAQLKVEAYVAAIQSCDCVLRLQPENVKALFRKGKVLGAQGDTDTALPILKKALTLEPENKIIHQELARLQQRRKRENQKQAAMYKRMFELNDKKDDDSKSNSFWRVGVITTIGAAVVAIASVVAYRYFT